MTSRWNKLKNPLYFWKKRKVKPATSLQGNEETETERFRLLDLSWEAWRHGQMIEQDSVLDVQASTMFCRRCAISEELEKHIWHKGYNLREIRRCIIVIAQLTRYGLA